MPFSPPTSPPKSPPQSPPKSPPASPPKSPPTSPPVDVLPACAPPDVRTPPEFRLPYRHPINLKQVFDLPPPPFTPPQFACADVPSLNASVAFDPRYEQLWSLQKLAIGDLASTL